MHIIDPLTDSRWAAFVDQHPFACAFHTQGWLRSLAETYGYEPFAVTASEPGSELTNALPFCRIQSWLTGSRLVSLPFTDHCQPLVSENGEATRLMDFVTRELRGNHEKFAELRPATPTKFVQLNDEHQSALYYIHWLNLTPPLEVIFNGLHKDSIQRKIRRAEREVLTYEEGRSPEILEMFYGLLMRTRRRHGVPPQPISWFRNLLRFMGDSIFIRVALKDRLPIASIITLKHRNSLIYKYGASDERYHATGGMPSLFWRMIEEAKSASIPLLDFGRSDTDNPGLIRFKDQWGTYRTELKYYRFPASSRAPKSRDSMKNAAEAVFACLPEGVLRIAGRLIYRHIG
jgi:lipid II:glycine glycyltransferase (peptidoglycan interpeptide bridge formation enzyme)